MGNTSSNSTKVTQTVNNNFINETTNQCTANDIAEIENVYGKVTVLKGEAISFGNILNTMTANCTIDQQLSQSAAAILKAQAEQQSEVDNDFLNDGVLFSRSSNSVDILQSTVNNMVNITTNTCNANVVSSIKNSAMGLDVGTAKDDIQIFTIANDTSASCVINNMVSQESYTDLESNVEQTSKIVGMFVSIFTALVSIMMIGLIAIVIIFGGGALIMGISKSGGKSGGEKETGDKVTFDDFDDDIDNGY